MEGKLLGSAQMRGHAHVAQRLRWGLTSNDASQTSTMTEMVQEEKSQAWRRGWAVGGAVLVPDPGAAESGSQVT